MDIGEMSKYLHDSFTCTIIYVYLLLLINFVIDKQLKVITYIILMKYKNLFKTYFPLNSFHFFHKLSPDCQTPSKNGE